MASRRTRTKSRERTGPLIQLDPQRWEEIAAIGVLILAALTALGAFNLSGGLLLGPWVELLQALLGWGVYLAPLLLAGLGVWLFLDALDRVVDIGWERPIALALGYLLTLSLFHWIAAFDRILQRPGPFEGGGLIGWGVTSLLVEALGEIGALLALAALGTVALIFFFNISLAEMLHRVADRVRQTAASLAQARHGLPTRLPQLSLPSWHRSPRAACNAPAPSAPRPPADLADVDEAEPAGWNPSEEPAATAEEATRAIPAPAAMPPPPPREWHLPDLEEILEGGAEQEISRDEIRNRVHVIEETLQHFGVPAKVVEVNQGPTITQFGVEPGFLEQKGIDGKLHRIKVKVSRISALQHDLELSLAAAPLRIEAPVPGRSVVGIEVPNSQIAVVSLQSVIESETFKNMKGKLKIALGQDVSGQPVCADLGSMPHLLIAGATGSGKSVCINATIATLLCTTTPAQVRFIMIDPKRVELVNFNGIPHLLQPVVVEVEGAIAALQGIVREMDDRYKLFATQNARNIDTYNRALEDKPEDKLPYLVVIVDELADLMMVAPDQVEHAITRLAQMARATGIHLILATQRPSVDVVTGLIKANFPARISFAVTSQVDSRVVLDTPGAEKLLGRGDMLYMASDSSKLHRLQGCYVSDTELEKLVTYWKAFGPPPEAPPSMRLDAGVQTSFMEMLNGPSDEELVSQAVDIVKKNNRASVSLLQRKLRIGYSRASRLMDQLEAKGIVGPDEGPSHGRTVLVQSETPAPSNGPSQPPAPERPVEDEFADFTEKDWEDVE